MANLEKFINDQSMCDYDPLVKLALFISSLKVSILFMTETEEQAE
jgi:hypothetical protein